MYVQRERENRRAGRDEWRKIERETLLSFFAYKDHSPTEPFEPFHTSEKSILSIMYALGILLKNTP